MATNQEQLIAAIRRIAKSDPEIRSLLTALKKRGALDGLVKLVGGADENATEDCCTDGQEADPQSPDDPSGGDSDGSIDGDRPDDGNTEKGMDGTYRMPDGSFSDWDDQPCTPDDSWEEGTYWTTEFTPTSGGTAMAAAIGALNKI